MFKSRKLRSGLVVAACGALGAVAGIAGSAAAPAHNGKVHASQVGAGGPGGPGGPGRGPGGHAVHSDEVSLNKAGTAFISETEDNGVLKGVSGSDATITEGTKTVTYKDVTITLPANATVMRNGAAAKLSDLKTGDHVHVSQSSDGTSVFAADASFRPPMGAAGRHRGPGGPPDGGPPPAP